MLLICALGWWLRMHALGQESLWLDEAISVGWSQLGVGDLIRTTAADVHPPSYYLLLQVWAQLAGWSEFSARFLSAALGTLCLPLLYACARRSFGLRVATLSAGLMALSQFHVFYSQEARNYALLTVLTLLSYTALAARFRRRGRRETLLYVASTASLVYVHLYAWFIVIAQNVYWLRHHSRRRSLVGPAPREWLIYQAVIAGLFLPWAAVLANQTRAVLANYWLGRPDAVTLINVLYQYSGSAVAFGVTLAVVAIVAYERIRMPRAGVEAVTPVQPGIFLGLWLIVPHVIPFAISQWVSPIYLPRATIVTLPAFVMLLAAAVWAIRQPWVRAGLILALLASHLWTIVVYYPTIWKQQWREVTHAVESVADPNAVIFFEPGYGQIGFDAYARRQDLRKQPFPAAGIELSDEVSQRFWVIVLEQPGLQSALETRLAPRYAFHRLQHFVAIDVYEFEISP